MTDIQASRFFQFDPSRTPSPCFVVDEASVERNLKILHQVQQNSGAKVLMALKAFSMFAMSSLFIRYLSGTCCSGVHEARLAFDYYRGDLPGQSKRELHVYNPAFKPKEIDYLLTVADHIVFNSATQWLRYKEQCLTALRQRPSLSFGLRINPMHSTGETPLYDPCVAGSRLGITSEEFRCHFADITALEGISGLHFHTLCEQGFDALAPTLEAVETQFAQYLPHMHWINFGGGHQITEDGYDREALIATCRRVKQAYDVQVYLEPGEAAVIKSGVLVSEVLDLPRNQVNLAILDSSATCHMPDTLEMPYRAEVFIGEQSGWPKNSVAGQKGDKPHCYRLGGQTCLAGDVMGDYSFDQPLQIGQRLMFDDMSHYTMVKTSTFNGMGLPALAIWNSDTDGLRIIKTFGYEDFCQRLS